MARTLVMAVLNVTPDSFSDGGRHASAAQAVEHGRRLFAEGADIVDVGGESTRPGAARVPEQEELDRVVPVVRELAGVGRVSVDTTRACVARAAVRAGASCVNDVSAGTADEDMLPVVAGLGVAYVAMHSRGPSADMQNRAVYGDVVAEVGAELGQRLAACRAAGIRDVVLDPGIGFAKTEAHNWALLAALPDLVALGLPVLVGASRKAFLGSLLGGREPLGRDAATLAVTVLAARAGAWAVRVHDAAGSADAVRVVERLGA